MPDKKCDGRGMGLFLIPMMELCGSNWCNDMQLEFRD